MHSVIIKQVIKMLINYKIDKINKLLYDFYNATGITIDLLKSDFSQVSHTPYEFNNYCKCIQSKEKGKNACAHSTQRLLEECRRTGSTRMHVCHAGLIDVAVPIIYENDIIGYMVFGQMKTNSDFSILKDYLKDLGLNDSEMEKHYNDISFYDSGKIESVSNIATVMIKHILLENMLKLNLADGIEKAVNYISDNLNGDLSIRSISQNINISKSVLYKNFHETFNCTISEYINDIRIKKSMEYLKNTTLSMDEISQLVGFSSASYFGKIFKKTNGTTPLKYRKNIQ